MWGIGCTLGYLKQTGLKSAILESARKHKKKTYPASPYTN